MNQAELNIVTGAFSFTGKYLTRKLLAAGKQVKTLTGHPDRPNEFGGRVEAFPYDFDNPERLRLRLEGVTTLYNTYWVRFPHGDMTYGKAVRNTETLVNAAADAGVQRIVHVSIANPSRESPFEYYRGKAEIEDIVARSGVSYTLVRPTVIFGPEDILINNIAWILRKLPVFGIPGDGKYRIQPVHVEDMAEILYNAGQQEDNIIMDAVGPEKFTFEDLVKLIRSAVGSKAKLIHLPPGLAYTATSQIGKIVGDMVLTKDEIGGLMADLLHSQYPPTGKIRLSEWLRANAGEVGKEYHSEIARHF